MFCRSLFVLLYFSFGHCVVCSSSIYGFWMLLWYLQALFAWPNDFIKKRERSDICVLEVSILLLSTILRFKFGIVPTAKSILFSSYSNTISHCGDQFHWWRIVEYPKKRTHLVQITEKFITWYCIEYTLLWTVCELTTLVVICTNCPDSCKSNNHTIKTTTDSLRSKP